MNWKRFVELHPQWKDWRYQLEQMANMVEERYKMYNGDIFRVVVHHNQPAAAKAGTDTRAGYWKHVLSKEKYLILDI